MNTRHFWSALYTATTIFVGALSAAYAFAHWKGGESAPVLLYSCAALLASRIRLGLPRDWGTMPVNLAFTLIGIPNLGFPQVLLIAIAGVIGEVLHRGRPRNSVQVLFRLATRTIAAWGAFFAFHSSAARYLSGNPVSLLMLSSVALLAANMFLESVTVALGEGRNVWNIWRERLRETASHCFAAACLAALFYTAEAAVGTIAALVIAAVLYCLYRPYSAHIDQLEEARSHSRNLGELHWRTIEALALAIDAKEETTHNHLLRVKVYATEVGKEMGLGAEQMQALEAAALLHDIGQLAVPEYISSKPGKLTPEEFEKMKVHPVVGAEILDRVQFPYPVVAVVRSHHEKWNGKGYPAGLKGEQIPIGARILAAVDCLDALASDRQYRKAIPLEKAMEIVASESGISFDPKVIEVLKRRYVELEGLVACIPSKRSAELERNAELEMVNTAAVFETVDESSPAPIDFMVSIAAARQEFQNLLKLTTEIDGLLSVEDIGSLLATRVRRMIPHDTIALYLTVEDKLLPVYVSGEDSGYFSNLSIPVGRGLSGWVVENRVPIVNGIPSAEHLGGPASPRKTRLRSALSVPLECRGITLGAMTLYSSQADYYTRDAVRILEAICAKVSVTIASAMQHERVATSAATDALTGLPNARSLFLCFEENLKNAQSQNSSLAVIVMDLNGFKHINDSYGHLTGNRVLQRIGTGLKESCRESDYVARLGGDEFVIIMPNAGADAVACRIQELNSIVSLTGEEWGTPSLSAGVAFYPEDGRSAEALLEVADKRMYKRKGEHYKEKFSTELLNATAVSQSGAALLRA